MEQSATLEMQMQSWRGYSAYELAVHAGFEGTQEEWLQSLKGSDGIGAEEITVNGREAVDGNITLRASDICVQAGSSVTVAQELNNKLRKDAVADSLTCDSAEKVLSAKQGKTLYDALLSCPKMNPYTVLLKAEEWTEEENLVMQSIALETVSEDENRTVVISAPPIDREEEALYTASQVKAARQTNGALVFTAVTAPDADLHVPVLVLETEVTA